MREVSIKRQKKKNREYSIVSGFFLLIFLSLIGYVAYFNGVRSQDFINSPYNTRQDTFADRVVRGDIESSDGERLAYTEVYEDGTEVRCYPYGRMFAHSVGYDSNGKSGLESIGNFQLLSSHAFFIDQLKNQFRNQKNQGDTVVTTLDYTVQSAAYYALGDRNGAVIAIEPSTGKIRAMVSKPDFDPNTIAANWDTYVNDSGSSVLLNRATNGAYPPGSTFKIVTALSYFRQRGTFEKFSFDCEGSITKEDHTIRCYGGSVHGNEDFYSAFASSCNTAFASIGVEIGGRALRETSESLLFNKKLPYFSSKSSVFSVDAKSPVPLLMQTSIGQGNTLVSPLHMAMIVSSVANHGVLMEPTLIDSVKNEEGQTVRRTRPQVYGRLMSNNEANLLDKLMRQVVSSGTASSLSGRSYGAAGKTGSAEYNESGASHSWFVGYCGGVNPDLVVAIIVEDGGTGSAAAVPIAGQVFDAYYTSHAHEETEENEVDYSDYEDAAEEGGSGWFDIVEEYTGIFNSNGDGTVSSGSGLEYVPEGGSDELIYDLPNVIPEVETPVQPESQPETQPESQPDESPVYGEDNGYSDTYGDTPGDTYGGTYGDTYGNSYESFYGDQDGSQPQDEILY